MIPSRSSRHCCHRRRCRLSLTKFSVYDTRADGRITIRWTRGSIGRVERKWNVVQQSWMELLKQLRVDASMQTAKGFLPPTHRSVRARNVGGELIFPYARRSVTQEFAEYSAVPPSRFQWIIFRIADHAIVNRVNPRRQIHDAKQSNRICPVRQTRSRG